MEENFLSPTPNIAPPTPPLLPEPSLARKLSKQLIVLGALLVLIVIGGIIIFVKTKSAQEPIQQKTITIPTIPMIIASDAFKNNDYIPAKYTCDGLNISPPFRFADIPADTASLVLIVDDPDAASGDWTHWLVWNIPSETASLEENSIPAAAVVGKNDFEENQYGGPCPPKGTHHYQFKLYALDEKLNLPANSNKEELLAAMQSHVIIEARLVGLYSQ